MAFVCLSALLHVSAGPCPWWRVKNRLEKQTLGVKQAGYAIDEDEKHRSIYLFEKKEVSNISTFAFLSGNFLSRDIFLYSQMSRATLFIPYQRSGDGGISAQQREAPELQLNYLIDVVHRQQPALH